MRNKRVLALALVMVMLLLCSCSKSEETAQQFSVLETTGIEQVATTETLSTETTGVLEEVDDETAQQFSTPETTVTEQVVTTENITTETTEALEELDNEYNPIFEQIYCDIVTSMYVDNVDINWEYEYKNDMLIIKKIKNGFSEEYKSIETYYDSIDDDRWSDAFFTWIGLNTDLEDDYTNIEAIALNRGYDGPIKLYFEDENGTDYLIYYCGLMLYTRIEDGDIQDEWQYWGVLDNGVLVKIREIGPPFDNYGDNVIVSSYTFVNYSDETQNFLSSFKVRAYQDGIECSDIVIVPDLDTEQLTDIKPDNSITVYVPFKLRDEYTPIEIEISELFSDNVLASRTFEIS